MPAGLQVFDENGKVTVDVSNRLTKILGILTIKRENGNGTQTDSRLSLGTPFWFIPYMTNLPDGDIGGEIEIVIDNNKVEWIWNNNAPANMTVTIIYGVF